MTIPPPITSLNTSHHYNHSELFNTRQTSTNFCSSSTETTSFIFKSRLQHPKGLGCYDTGKEEPLHKEPGRVATAVVLTMRFGSNAQEVIFRVGRWIVMDTPIYTHCGTVINLPNPFSPLIVSYSFRNSGNQPHSDAYALPVVGQCFLLA